MESGKSPEEPLSTPQGQKQETRARFHLLDSYGLVLAFIILSVSAIAASADSFLVLLCSDFLLAITLLLALWTSGAGQRTMYFGLGALTISVGTVVVQAFLPGEQSVWLPATIDMVLILITPVVMVRRVLMHRIVKTQTALGALCVYLLIGLFFACLYATFDFFIPVPVFTKIPRPTISDYLYFSFVTLTTLGYGDLSPQGGCAARCALRTAAHAQPER